MDRCFVFQDKLASLVGNPGLGNVLAMAGIAIPLTSISSVQLALLRGILILRHYSFLDCA